jgi:hypothetical protein
MLRLRSGAPAEVKRRGANLGRGSPTAPGFGLEFKIIFLLGLQAGVDIVSFMLFLVADAKAGPRLGHCRLV